MGIVHSVVRSLLGCPHYTQFNHQALCNVFCSEGEQLARTRLEKKHVRRVLTIHQISHCSFSLVLDMIEHESAFELFQRLHSNDKTTIDRLNHYHHTLFPNGFTHTHAQLIEVLDADRMATRTFLHGFISDYIDCMSHRNDLLRLPFQSQEILSNSPRANKDSDGSDVPVLQATLNCNESITFLYLDTECKECPFDNEAIQWFDCGTSTELIGTLLRLEQSSFRHNGNHRYILIIDSSTQVCVRRSCIHSEPTFSLSPGTRERLLPFGHSLSRPLTGREQTTHCSMAHGSLSSGDQTQTGVHSHRTSRRGHAHVRHHRRSTNEQKQRSTRPVLGIRIRSLDDQ